MQHGRMTKRYIRVKTVKTDMTYKTYAGGLLAGGGGSLGFKGLIAYWKD